MKFKSGGYQVKEGEKIILKAWPTQVKPVYRSKEQYQEFLELQVAEPSKLQRLHYASSHYGVLPIFQAMDASGKDGTNRHVMSSINPQGCKVFSFKHRNATELEHDFMWRNSQCLLERSRIGIFSRPVTRKC